jgi:hypothetical protein
VFVALTTQPHYSIDVKERKMLYLYFPFVTL